MGKTRLVHEFRHSLAAIQVTYLAAQCVSYGQATPYLPVLDILRRLCDLTEADSPAVVTAKLHRRLHEVGLDAEEEAPYLLHLLGVSTTADQLGGHSPEAIRIRTFAALHRFVVQASQRQPLILEVENLHWIDPTSEAYLMELVEQLVGVPIVLLVTSRPGYQPPWIGRSYATQLTLPRLSTEDSQRLVASLLDTAQVPTCLIQELLTKAAGNPFFLEELARAVGEQQTLRLPTEVPDTIQTVLTSRIDRLPPEAKHLLQVAAVIGPEVPMPLLQTLAVLPEAALDQSLAHLQGAEFLYHTRRAPTPTYTFTHILIREAAYQSLLHSTRQHYHRQIAQFVEEHFPETAERQPELLAHHYTEAGLHEQAMPYWQRAGQHALERSAYVEAIRHLTPGLKVLQALPATPERTQHELMVHGMLCAALVSKGYGAPEVEQAYARTRALCQQVETTPQLAPVLYGLMRFYSVRAEHSTARELAEDLWRLAERLHDPALFLPAHVALGASLFFSGAFAPAREQLAHALARYDAQQHHAYLVQYGEDFAVVSLAVTARALWYLGYPDQALVQVHQLLRQAREIGHLLDLAMALNQMARLHQLRREVQAMDHQAQELMALATEQGFPYWVAEGILYWGWALAMQGQEQGLTKIRQGLAAMQATGAELEVPYTLARLAEACGQVGRTKEGLAVLAEALGIVATTGERLCEAELHRLQGELFLKQDAPHTQHAVACLHRALDVARQQQAKSLELRAAMSLSRLWQQQGKRTEARQVLAEVYDWFTEGFDTADFQDAKTLLDELA